MSADGWAPLVDAYAANRTGYSHELYDAIAAFGLRRGATIVDIGFGTGIASQPFVSNGFAVTGVDSSEAMLAQAAQTFGTNVALVCAPAEALPFPNERFDVAISAQAFHWFDRAKALSEMHRVLRSGGMLAIWWKRLAAHDSVNLIREEVLRGFTTEAPPSGLSGGFREFYAAPLRDQIVRVVPWRTTISLQRFMGYERSRCGLAQILGSKTEAYAQELERRLQIRFGEGDPLLSVAYMQYVYLAKKP